MTDDPSPRCCDSDGPNADHDPSAGLLRDDVLDADLPPDLGSALGRFLGSHPVETLAEWVDAVRHHTGGGPVDVGDLCLTDERTPHWGTVDGERHHFACFYDAVILAAISDRPVDVRTVSPGGEVIDARAAGGTGLAVTPDDAVFSFGIGTDGSLPSAEPTLERAYALVCPYVRAFPRAEAYERWAERVPAATVAAPLAGATEVAAALARD